MLQLWDIPIIQFPSMHLRTSELQHWLKLLDPYNLIPDRCIRLPGFIHSYTVCYFVYIYTVLQRF
jgi:hypothetical protein